MFRNIIIQSEYSKTLREKEANTIQQKYKKKDRQISERERSIYQTKKKQEKENTRLTNLNKKLTALSNELKKERKWINKNTCKKEFFVGNSFLKKMKKKYLFVDFVFVSIFCR